MVKPSPVVLIFVKSEVFQETLRKFLTHRDCQSFCARDLESALAFADDRAPNAILTDHVAHLVPHLGPRKGLRSIPILRVDPSSPVRLIHEKLKDSLQGAPLFRHSFAADA